MDSLPTEPQGKPKEALKEDKLGPFFFFFEYGEKEQDMLSGKESKFRGKNKQVEFQHSRA